MKLKNQKLTEEYDRVLAKLRRGFDIGREIDALMVEKERLVEMLGNIVKPLKAEGGHGSQISDSTGDLAVKLADRERKLDEKILQKEDERTELLTYIITECDNPTDALILQLRFVNCMRWEEIERRTYFSEKYPQKRCRKAITNIAFQNLRRSKAGNEESTEIHLHM